MASTPIPAALEDEVTSINSIYDSSDSSLQTLELQPASSSTSSDSRILTILRLPYLTPSISLRLAFPSSYPDAPPQVLGTHSVGENAPIGAGTHAVEVAKDVMEREFRAGEPVIFDFIGAVVPLLESEDPGALEEERPEGFKGDEGPRNGLEKITSSEGGDNKVLGFKEGEEPPWVISETVTEKKSVFVARAAKVKSPEQAKAFIEHLVETDKKVAKATHNISAWRIGGAGGEGTPTYQDYDDDGETAAGGRLLRLMQMMEVWDVVVVVTRWYGGILLGPARFGVINGVARDALMKGGFAKEESGGGGGKKGKK
ncbi:UPF0029-domain-containing protein [Aulographum hederae CBS 113979]|uniref:UPF0029-domain-containing protein n=1 Tax=Aulographum hederae CBS 113979 TaxID=1176131 RepID=A0A6G1HDZ9_9PEZI|nr:UPF0029-domain-containing protein [Aulographum hederae CBS 113979]